MLAELGIDDEVSASLAAVRNENVQLIGLS